MASANAVFPLLPAKDLSLILFRIFQELVEDRDICAYRLVNKGWRDFIDSHILSSPVWRRRFLQHPLGMLAQQRRPLIRAKLPDRYFSMFEVFERGQYVLLNDWGKLGVFTKTNVALKARGSATLKPAPCNQLKNALVMCQDYLFQLHSNTFVFDVFGKAPVRLQSFKREDEDWIPCQHPKRGLWEQEGMEILGMRQVSDSKVFLLVLVQGEGLLQVIDVSAGTIKLVTKSLFTEMDVRGNRPRAVVGNDSDIFDMDAFGLVLGSEEILQHFSFEANGQTWHMNHLCGMIRKARKVTVIDNYGDLAIVDNTSGAITHKVDRNHLSSLTLWFRNHQLMEMSRDEYLFLGGSKEFPKSIELKVLSISENRVMSFPVETPFIVLDGHCEVTGHMIAKQSESTMLCTLTIEREDPRTRTHRLWSAVLCLDVRQPERTVVLSHPIEKSFFIGCVPCEHGFFALTELHSNNYELRNVESWKY